MARTVQQYFSWIGAAKGVSFSGCKQVVQKSKVVSFFVGFVNFKGAVVRGPGHVVVELKTQNRIGGQRIF
mgnify:CR=1 FL=1